MLKRLLFTGAILGTLAGQLCVTDADQSGVQRFGPRAPQAVPPDVHRTVPFESQRSRRATPACSVERAAAAGRR